LRKALRTTSSVSMGSFPSRISKGQRTRGAPSS
jgi:hypothetical protein